MKILIARLNHETNTFSPVPTPLAAFLPTYGEAAYRDNLGMRTAMAAFIDMAQAIGATLVTPLSATANPSGPVQAQAYNELTACIVYAASGCDAILLDLHGAMVAENSADGEGDLLARVRAAAPGVPIGVALDLHGNVAAATSTGGMTNKIAGRVGDAPIPGAGTYACNRSVAVSFTGTGEHILRTAAGHQLAALIEHKGLSVPDAMTVLLAELTAIGAEVGIIAIGPQGGWCIDFNTTGMLRGSVDASGNIVTAMFIDGAVRRLAG